MEAPISRVPRVCPCLQDISFFVFSPPDLLVVSQSKVLFFSLSHAIAIFFFGCVCTTRCHDKKQKATFFLSFPKEMATTASA